MLWCFFPSFNSALSLFLYFPLPNGQSKAEQVPCMHVWLFTYRKGNELLMINLSCFDWGRGLTHEYRERWRKMREDAGLLVLVLQLPCAVSSPTTFCELDASVKDSAHERSRPGQWLRMYTRSWLNTPCGFAYRRSTWKSNPTLSELLKQWFTKPWNVPSQPPFKFILPLGLPRSPNMHYSNQIAL